LLKKFVTISPTLLNNAGAETRNLFIKKCVACWFEDFCWKTICKTDCETRFFFFIFIIRK